MTNSDALNNSDDTEVERKPFWTRTDKLLAVFGALINLGHGVETYLPGVITQQISCVTELSEVAGRKVGLYTFHHFSCVSSHFRATFRPVWKTGVDAVLPLSKRSEYLGLCYSC